MGLIDGVISTTAGWLEDGEVVEVEFDPEVVSYEELLTEAERRGCTDRVFPQTDRQELAVRSLVDEWAKRTDEVVQVDDDTRYYLQQTPLRFLPMTALQAVRANGYAQGGLPPGLLSPSQEELLKRIEAAPGAGWPLALDRDLREAWAAAMAISWAIE